MGQWLAVVLVCGMLVPATRSPTAQRSAGPGAGRAGDFSSSQPGAAGPHACINEFLASNSTSLANDKGSYEDWIELYNPSPSPVDVGGVFLTDDPTEPTKWQIPPAAPELTTLAPGGFILIWADGGAGGTGLHANFKLSSEGEELALYDKDGTTRIDSVAFGKQNSDTSFGRYPDGAAEWSLLTAPTPGTRNADPWAGPVADVKFSVEHGFYDEPFDVALSTDTPDTQIWYTRDGTLPHRTEDGRWDALLYDHPIRVDHVICLRAVAVKPGWRDSSVTSCTYIFIDDIPAQLAPASPGSSPVTPPGRSRSETNGGSTNPTPVQNSPPADPALRKALKAIPSVCIVMEPNDFSDPVRGINANPSQRGVEWERPASVEWVDPAGRLSLQVNVGLRIHGGVSRSSGRNGKHSLRLLFKSQHGPATLDAPLFEDCPITRFDSLVLRCTLHDSWTGSMGQNPQYLRDQFSRDTMRDMGRLTPYGQPVHVYINGQYWGLYILTERPDDGFAAAHLGGDKEQYDALKAKSVSDPDPAVLEVVAGDLKAWNTLFTLARGGGEDPVSYDRVRQYLDLPSFIDYMLMIFYIGSTDGPAGIGGPPRNFWALRPRENPGGFVFLAWDLEFSLQNLNENRVTVEGTEDPHFLFQQLAANAEFRMQVADHIHRQLCHGALTPESATDRYLARSADIQDALWAEAFRWGNNNHTSAAANGLCNSWRNERDRIVQQYFPARSGIVVEQLRQAGLYTNVEPPVLEVDGQESLDGTVPTGTRLAITHPNEGGTIYYTIDGSDPRTPYRPVDMNQLTLVIPRDAEKRVYVPTADIGNDWTGGSEPYDDTNWTAGTPVVLSAEGGVGYLPGRSRDNRISYYVGPAMAGHASCYIRIPFHVAPADLPRLPYLALHVQCDDGFVAYVNGVEVASLNRPDLLAWDSSCEDRPATASPVWAGIPKNAALLHAGENVLALHALDNDADRFFLLSLELFGCDHAIFGEGVAATAQEYVAPIELTQSTQLKARVWRGGTWSALTEAVFAVGPVRESLRITELMYHPPEPNEEFIELANPGAEPINLNMVRFVDGVDFTFSSLWLAPGQVTLVVQDRKAFADRYGPASNVAGRYDGSLSNAGEHIRLQDAAGNIIQDFRYEDAWYASTDGQGRSLERRDPRHQDSNDPSRRECWQPSQREGGSPGILE